VGLLEKQEWPHVATALEACELWRVSAGEFRRLCRYHPDFTLEVARSLSGKAMLFSAKIESLLFKSIRARLVECLNAVAERFGTPRDGRCLLDVPLTQQNLADLIGASRQHVSSALTSLASRGLIQRPRGRRGRYEIPDIAALRAAAEGF
jgi:CRP/FNR family transcriptional regulator